MIKIIKICIICSYNDTYNLLIISLSLELA